MTTKDEALALALEALEKLWLLGDQAGAIAGPAITAIKQAQEPVELEDDMLDAAISWCDSNGINVLEPEQLASLVNSLFVTVRDASEQAQEPPTNAALKIIVRERDWTIDYLSLPVGKHELFTKNYTYNAAPKQAEPKPRTIDLGRYAGTYGGTLPTPPEAK
jgi:hypothetical protein